MSEKNNYYSLSGRPYPSALTLKEVDQDHQTGIQYRYEEFPHQIFEPPEGRFLAEIELLKFMQAVVEKPDWDRKFRDPEIWEKWKQEAKEAIEERCRSKEKQSGDEDDEDDDETEYIQKYRFALTDDVLDYALDELKCCADLKDQNNGMEWSGVDLIWKSDTLIPPDLHSQLSTLVDDLTAKSPEKDWHPGSDNQVLDVIHPSLFCLVYNRSTKMDGSTFSGPKEYSDGIPDTSPIGSRRNSVLADSVDAASDNGSLDDKDEDLIKHVWSSKYQWLPAQFLVNHSRNVKIASYIPSLHPSSGLYPIIAKIFSLTIPLFERVINDLSHNRSLVRFPIPDNYEWWDGSCGYLGIPEEIYADIDYDDLAARDRVEREFLEKELEPLPIPKFDPKIRRNGIIPGTCTHDCFLELTDVRLQVIVKIGSIHLTPEQPAYAGGKWHVEGMANEKIVATCIYYYDSDNIEGDSLRFRQAVTMDGVGVPQDDTVGVSVMFGIERHGRLVQDLGRVKTPGGRVICFPNLFQHAISPFSLKDPTKPGHRKILVFFLIDPTQQVVSTKDIPPQDIRWLEKDMETVVGDRLPPELKGMIAEHWNGMTLEEAKKHRLALMKERSRGNQAIDKVIFSAEYNFCEH